jgi:SpoVK/Ycf46/Vps4 family AAA+-type ATPase
MTLNAEMVHHLRALTRLVYVVTDEEDNFIKDFQTQMAKHEDRTWVYNWCLGLKKINDLTKDWTQRTHTEGTPRELHDALTQVYKDDPKDKEHFYIFTDPERIFRDEQAVRRVLNIIHQLHMDLRVVKCLIFVSTRRVIPEKLSRYFEIVDTKGLQEEELTTLVTDFCKQLQTPVPANIGDLFRGFTSFEVEAAITQSVVQTKKDSIAPKRVDPVLVSKYKRNQIKKTDLVQIVDSSKVTFDSVGGAECFKEWARSTQSCWTEEGKAFGLVPPRGVLLMGVYGCGKSLSAKALASEWKLPLIQFEMGKLRNSAVGESEANLYRALRIVESVSPCIMWIDEAEKSLSGGDSSAQSDAGTTSRLLGILSTWTQESRAPACLVMTANSLRTMPAEMVNRMPERFFFDIPDEETLIDIIKIHAKAFSQDVSNFNLALMAEKADGLVGREIEQAVEASMVKSFNAKKPGLDYEILLEDLTRRPRIIKTMSDEIRTIIDWVGFDKEAKDGVRARFASKGRSTQFKTISAALEEKSK